MKASTSLVLGFVVLVVLTSGCVHQENSEADDKPPEVIQHPVQENTGAEEENNEESLESPPRNLALPFDAEDMFTGNEFISPFGLIRHERDKGHGHAGIDISLSKGDAIYAVSDGEIIIDEPASEGDGSNVVLLISSPREGEGWAFLYEHIVLKPGIDIGSRVSRGQLIGESSISGGSNHLGLVYYFNDFKYTREPKCWVEHLSDEDEQELLDSWENIRNSPELIEGWRNAFEDGAYAYRALLDKERFPSGPQLCYKYGLDVREFD